MIMRFYLILHFNALMEAHDLSNEKLPRETNLDESMHTSHDEAANENTK